MSAFSTRVVFNILAICGSAAFGGVMLSIGLSFGGLWQSMPPEDFLLWFAENNSWVSRPIPFVVVAATIGIVGSMCVTWTNRMQRNFWIASALCLGIVILVTFGYFVPANIAFAEGSILASAIPSHLTQWLYLHSLRIFLGFAAPALGVIAVALPTAD